MLSQADRILVVERVWDPFKHKFKYLFSSAQWSEKVRRMKWTILRIVKTIRIVCKLYLQGNRKTRDQPVYLLPAIKHGNGSFTNYVYKSRGVGGQKNWLFANHYTIENVNGGG